MRADSPSTSVVAGLSFEAAHIQNPGEPVVVVDFICHSIDNR